MTRTTQSNIVRQNTTIFPVSICPLNYSWFFAFFATIRANYWFPFFSTNPLMKTSIADTSPFPHRMILICHFFFNSFYAFFFKFFRAFSIKLIWFSYRNPFFFSGKLMTFARTIISRLNHRRKSPQGFFTVQTFSFYHNYIIATMSGGHNI